MVETTSYKMFLWKHQTIAKTSSSISSWRVFFFFFFCGVCRRPGLTWEPKALPFAIWTQLCFTYRELIFTSSMEFIPSTTIYLITLLSFSMPFATSATIFDFENCEFPAIFNFGDSNSDTGGLAASFTPPNFPNGETYFDMPAGRYCDGRLIIDFICKSFFFNFGKSKV